MSGSPLHLGAPPREVRNEFAAVRLTLDSAANDLRLHIEDLETGAVALLDAFALRSLCRLPPEALLELCRATVPGGG